MENELSRVVDALPGLIWTTLPDGSCDFVNQRWCDYTGLRAVDAYGQGWQTTIHPDDLPPLGSMLTSDEPQEVEARMRRFDGTYRWFLFRASPVLDASGRVARWCGVNTDIEDRKRSEEALRGAEVLLAGEKRLLEMVARGDSMEGILDALCQLAESTAGGCYCSVVLVDPGGARLERGAAPSLPASFIASIVGRPVTVDSGPCATAAYLNEPVVAEDLASETRWAASGWCPMAMAHGLRACWSTPISSTSGRVLGAFALYYDTPGAPTSFHQGLVEQFTDIASIAIEREHAQASLTRALDELRRSERRLRTIIDTIPANVWYARADGCGEFWNKRWQDYAGFAPAETCDEWAAIVHRDDLARLQDAMGATVPYGRPGQVEQRLRRFDGEYRWFLSRWEPLCDESGSVLNWYGANTDIDDAKRAEEALGKVRSELAHVARVTTVGALTASIAHEVNQPLSGIITNASTCLRMLAADPPNIDGARETARRTIRDGNRASDVITRLRALFSHAGVRTEPVDLNEATREVIALSASELQRSRVIVRPELADNLPSVAGDRVQLQQVILNLLLNANDAMSAVDDRPRYLVIRTEPESGDRVRLAVQDAGVGLEPQSVDKLFDAFYTTKHGGMGIGLSVSRSIIESHQGRLWAAPNEGPGATFVFSLPLAPEGVTRAEASRTVRTASDPDMEHGAGRLS